MENEQNVNSLLDSETSNQETQAPSDGNGLLDSGNKEQNAFQVIQQKLNSEKEMRIKLEQELNSLKQTISKFNIGNTNTNQNTEAKTGTDNLDVSKIEKLFEEKIESKVGDLKNKYEEQLNEMNFQKVQGTIKSFAEQYGMTKTELGRFISNLNISGTGFEDSYEGRQKYLLSLADYPQLIHDKLYQVSPEAMLQLQNRKSKLETKNAYKQQTFTPRVGNFNSNLDGQVPSAKAIVDKFLEKQGQQKKQPLKYVGKVSG